MYDVALTVEACLQAGTRVDVAWVVAADGLPPGAVGQAVAITPGGGRVGSLLDGAFDEQVAEIVAAGVRRRLVTLLVSEVDALVAGLPAGAQVQVALMPAQDMPADLWERLRVRDAVVLVARLDGEDIVSVAAQAVGDDDATASAVTADEATTALRAVPRLVIVGAGPIPDALAAAAQLLGWQVQPTVQVAMATGLIAGLAPLDKLVVAAHDEELAGPALAAALGSQVGYIGGLGSRRMQQTRADWLAYRGITDLTRVHGPAGLDIGASTPAEIAVSVLAEAVAVASGRTVAPGSDST